MNKILKSANGQEYIIIKPKGQDVVIKFVQTGYECRARKHLVESGRVYDPTEKLEEQKSWTPCYLEFTNNDGEKFHAFKKKGNKLKIVFPKTNYTTEVYEVNAQAGKVKDPFSYSVYGVGFVGLVDKSIPYWKQAKQLWQNMMKRCYSSVDTRGYFEESFVDDRWKSFENFLCDISKLDGFKGWLEAVDGDIKFNLDKDFIMPGNKIYSRHFCCFLPENFNKSMGKKGKSETDWA